MRLQAELITSIVLDEDELEQLRAEIAGLHMEHGLDDESLLYELFVYLSGGK